MKIMKKFLSFVLAVCMLLSLSVGVAAATLVLQSTDLVIGTNQLTLTNAATVAVFEFIPGEAGVFRITLTGDDCALYSVSGSKFYLYNPQVVENNTKEVEVKESYINTPMLVGAAGTGTATLTIERVGEAAFDVNALPYETYETTAALTKFTKDPAIEILVYVDVSESHTAELGEDGYYHLDTVDGPVLYMDFGTTAPYLSIASAATNGAMKDVYFDEQGNFIKKEEYITCINEYFGYTDNTTNLWVAGYTDGGIYPLTYDLVYIMQNHTENCGWNDVNSLNYLFTDITVDADTAWMFPVCYGLYKGDVNGDFVVNSSDAVHLLYHSLLPNSYSIAVNGDLDGDSEVTENDAILLLYHALLPEQYPLV